MKLFTLIAGILLFLQDFTDRDLMGTWKWVKSSGGMLGIETTAEKSGVSRTISFSRDHVALFYVGDSLTFKNNFFILQEKTIFSEQPENVLKIKGTLKSQSIDFIGKDTLILRENAFDGFTHTYVRSSH